MTSISRVRKGAETVSVRVESAVVVEVGDLIFLDTDSAKPAASEGWTTSLTITRQGFKNKFLGVSADASPVGDLGPINVVIDCIVEFPCTSATYEVGDLVVPTKAAGNALQNQHVSKTATATEAIGIVWERVNPAGTFVLFRTRSQVLDGIAIGE